MIKDNFIEGLQPSRLRQSVEKRGLKATATHAVRRLGTVMERALTGPQVVRINPMGFVCNHTCPMCWLQHLPPEELKRQKKRDREEGMKLAEYRAFFDSMTPGLREVNVVGGGEPLVHPDCVDIMAEVKAHGWRGSLISNGALLKEEVAREMVKMRWDDARISVHAGDPETYRAIQGVDHFEIVVENLKRFDRLRREAGAREACGLVLFHVIQRENLGNLPKLFEVAEAVGADRIVFERLIPYDEKIRLSREEIAAARDEFQTCVKASRVPCNAGAIEAQFSDEANIVEKGIPVRVPKRCSVGFDESFVTSFGEVMPCCFSNEEMGNVREMPFRDIWYGPKYTEFRTRLIQGRFAKYCADNHCALAAVLHY